MTDARQPKTDSLVSLRDYMDARFDAMQLAVDKANEVLNTRLSTSEIAMERRLDVLNHLRESVLSKAEFASAHSALSSEFHGEASMLRAEVAMLKEWKAEQGGKASMSAVYIAYAIAVASLIASVATAVHSLLG